MGELKHVVVKLVSQLAQVPSTAALIRDVLLEMETAQRQQLQEMILASVVQDQHTKPMSSSGPALVIKLPNQANQQNVEKAPTPLPVPKDESENGSTEDEEDGDDDDWDTFQSFPASGNESLHTQENYPENATSISDGDSGFTSFSKMENPHSEDKLDEVSDTIVADINQLEETPSCVDDSGTVHQESDGKMASNGDDPLSSNVLSEDHLKITDMVYDESIKSSSDFEITNSTCLPDEHQNEASGYDDHELTDHQPSELSMVHPSVASEDNLVEEGTRIPQSVVANEETIE